MLSSDIVESLNEKMFCFLLQQMYVQVCFWPSLLERLTDMPSITGGGFNEMTYLLLNEGLLSVLTVTEGKMSDSHGYVEFSQFTNSKSSTDTVTAYRRSQQWFL